MEQRPSSNGPIFVTKAYLPPEEEYFAQIRKAYATGILTNNGPIHKELEETLRVRADVPFYRLMSNGTLAIQLAIRALGIRGKVITTPYSYVATTSAILWEGCEPVFVDIDPHTCCIDPSLIEAAITPDTTAILATHVYGIPCDVEAIEAIARTRGLKVIYDAAHAFDVTYKGRSILQWGDASTLSFHATKLFHTVEGGAVVLHNDEHDRSLRLLRSFGHVGDEHFMLGMNAKMSEVHASMGMAVLPHVPAIIEARRRISQAYDVRLQGLGLWRPSMPGGTGYNYAYYPVLLPSAAAREKAIVDLSAQNIHVRRYFFPSLNVLPYVRRTSMPVSEDRAARVLCLPFYAGLGQDDVERVVQALRSSLS